MNSQKINFRRTRMAALISLSLIFAVAVFFVTPQGRALAQEGLQFFSRSAQDTQPLPTLAAPVVTIDSAQSEAPEALPTTGTENLPPFQETCGGLTSPRCSLAEIRPMVDFQVRELATAPKDTQLIGATGGPQQVTLVYAGDGMNGTLWLQQEPLAAGEPQVWTVAADAIVESVMVGDAFGEYVQGGWFGVDTNDGTLGWHADAGIQTLRWAADSMRYTLVFHAGKMAAGILLDKEAMVGLAGTLVGENPENISPSPTPQLSLAQLSQMTGFEVSLPVWLPDGYTFQKAAYFPQRNGACLYYHYAEGAEGWPLLTIFESPASLAPGVYDIKMEAQSYDGQLIDIPLDVSTLPVGGAEGGLAQFVGNGVDAGKLCSYPGLVSNRALVWQAGGKGYVIFGLLDQYQGRGFISRLEMQRIAESLTGVATLEDTLDPERLLTVEDAETLAGFDVREPTQMLADMHFDHAVVHTGDGLNEVYMVYSGSGNGDGRRYGFSFSQAVGETQSLEDTFLAGGYENLTIHAQPAIYREICWSDISGNSAECYQEASWYEDGTRFDIQAYLPGALEKETFLKIAESMQ